MSGGWPTYKAELLKAFQDASPEPINISDLMVQFGVSRNACRMSIDRLRKVDGLNITNAYGGWFTLVEGKHKPREINYQKVIKFFEELEGDQFTYKEMSDSTGLTCKQIWSALTKLELDGIYSIQRYHGLGSRTVIRH